MMHGGHSFYSGCSMVCLYYLIYSRDLKEIDCTRLDYA